MSIKISELPQVSVVLDNDLFVINDNSGTNSITSSISAGSLIPFVKHFIDSIVVFDGGSVGIGFIPDCNNGNLQKYSIMGDVTLYAPTNGSIGKKIVFWITAPSSDSILSLDGAILKPSDSTFTGTKTVTANKTYIVQLQHNGAVWMLTSLVGGY